MMLIDTDADVDALADADVISESVIYFGASPHDLEIHFVCCCCCFCHYYRQVEDRRVDGHSAFARDREGRMFEFNSQDHPFIFIGTTHFFQLSTDSSIGDLVLTD